MPLSMINITCSSTWISYYE